MKIYCRRGHAPIPENIRMWRGQPRCRKCGNENAARHRARQPKPSPKGRPARPSPEERFWTFVNKTESCWLWTGGVFKSGGYGAFRAETSTVRAHRWLYERSIGPIPPGYYLCHTCDTPRCVNPDHLIPGTQQDNMDDCWSKGRARPRGLKMKPRPIRVTVTEGASQ